MSDFRVPVRSWINGPTYRALAAQAQARGIQDVGTLLAELADDVATGAVIKPKRKWARLTADKKSDIERLAGQGLSQAKIARMVGLGYGTVNRYLRELGS